MSLNAVLRPWAYHEWPGEEVVERIQLADLPLQTRGSAEEVGLHRGRAPSERLPGVAQLRTVELVVVSAGATRIRNASRVRCVR